jgi:hypothetical protein
VHWVVENVQHPATFPIQLDFVSKGRRIAGRFGLIEVVGDLRQRMLAECQHLDAVMAPGPSLWQGTVAVPV